VAVHFDVDLVHFLDAPLAENTDREGVTLEVAADRAAPPHGRPRFRALTVTEHNPLHGAATDPRPAARRGARSRAVLMERGINLGGAFDRRDGLRGWPVGPEVLD
jgi:hypothetical protein